MTQHLETPLNYPSVWRGQDLAETDDWIIELDKNQLEDLEISMLATEQLGIELTDITTDDFPLPTLSQLCLDLQSQLEGGRGFALIRSLPVRHYSPEQIALMFWGLGTHLGHPEPQDGAGNLLHHVHDTGKDLDTHNVRAYQTNQAINYHNDGADIFLLLCLNSAQHGGRSKLVSSAAAFNEILQRRPDLAQVLQQPFYFDARGQQQPDMPPYQHVPIFNYHADRLNVLYKREYIDLALRFPEVPPLTELQTEALDLLDEICDNLALEFTQEPGDILIANNYDLLHARAAFEDDDTPSDQKRHMLRLWLSLPNGRSNAPIYATTREFRYSCARRQMQET